MTIAYKFLASGAIGPLSRVAWPAPGEWLDTGTAIVGKRGAHVCNADQLAHWLHDELWTIEVEGPQLAAPDCFVVTRARLVERVAGWDPIRFARACIDHAAGGTAEYLADAEDALRFGYPAIAAYNAALAVAHDDEALYAAERAWQSAWIADELL
jgi:hypothetical protein